MHVEQFADGDDLAAGQDIGVGDVLVEREDVAKRAGNRKRR